MSGAVFPAVKPTCAKKWHRARTDLPDPIFMTAAAAMSSSITPFTLALTHLLKAPSPPPSALLICVVAANYITAILSKHQNAELLYNFLNYAWLDLIAKKYLAYCLQRSRKHFQELLLQYLLFL